MCWIGSQGEPRELQVIEQALCSFVRVGDKKRPNQSFQRTRQSAPLNSNVRSLNTLTVVLDTNCIAEDGEARAEAISVRALADAHSSGTADVRLVAISASERQKSGGHLETFSEFQDRMASLNLGHLPLLLPMMYWDATYWDECLWADPTPRATRAKQAIHREALPARRRYSIAQPGGRDGTGAALSRGP